jgi:CheY-like chemotaxis protein
MSCSLQTDVTVSCRVDLERSYVCCRTDIMTSDLYVLSKPKLRNFLRMNIETRNAMDMRVIDSRKVEKSQLILVVEDVYETRAGIDTLLKADGYRVALASTEGEAGISHRTERPDLILVSGSGLPDNVLLTVGRVRSEATVGYEVPVVVFCAQDISEGEEVAIGGNVYLTNPDNFNQLRGLVARLLLETSHCDVTKEEEQSPAIYDK